MPDNSPAVEPDSVWADDVGRLHCELCNRVSEVPEDAALASGWILSWDGPLCPQHAH